MGTVDTDGIHERIFDQQMQNYPACKELTMLLMKDIFSQVKCTFRCSMIQVTPDKNVMIGSNHLATCITLDHNRSHIICLDQDKRSLRITFGPTVGQKCLLLVNINLPPNLSSVHLDTCSIMSFSV